MAEANGDARGGENYGSQEAEEREVHKTVQEIMELAVKDIAQIRDVLLGDKCVHHLIQAKNLTLTFQHFLQMLKTEFKTARPWENKPDSQGYVKALVGFSKMVDLYNNLLRENPAFNMGTPTHGSSAGLLTGQGSQGSTRREPLKPDEEIMEIAVRDINQIKEMLAIEFGTTRPWEGKPDTDDYIEAVEVFSNYVNLYNDLKEENPAFAKEFRIPLTADIAVKRMCGQWARNE